MSRGRNRDKDLAYKRAEYKSEAPGIHREQGRRVSRAGALYDPRRDAPLRHASPVAELLGDPPIGWHQLFTPASARGITLAGES